jgi:hypothetical protein
VAAGYPDGRHIREVFISVAGRWQGGVTYQTYLAA